MPRGDGPARPVELLEVRQVILAGGARDARPEEAAVAPLAAVAPGGAGGDARLECDLIYPSDSFIPNVFEMENALRKKEVESGRGRDHPVGFGLVLLTCPWLEKHPKRLFL